MSIISDINTRFKRFYSKVGTDSTSYEVFSCRRKIGINMEEYMNHLKEMLDLDEGIFIQSFNLIQKLREKYVDFQIDDFNHINVFLTSLFLAAKLNYNRKHSVKEFSSCGAVPLGKLLAMEAAFLDLLDWNLHVSQEINTPCTNDGMLYAVYSDYMTDPSFCVISEETSDDSFDEALQLQWEDNQEFSELSLYFTIERISDDSLS